MDIDFANLLGMAGNASGTLSNAMSALAEFRTLAKDGKLPAEAGETILTLSTQLSEAQVKLAHLGDRDTEAGARSGRARRS